MRTFTSLPKTLLAGLTAAALMGVVPAGASTRPQVSTTSSAHAVKVVKVKFHGTFKGTIAMLWSSTGAKATSVKGTGAATYLGKATMTGTGSAPAASTCDPLTGTGFLRGAGSMLHLTVINPTKSQACAAGQSAPTSVSVKGVAKILGGAGKWRGATGTLSFTGSFSIQKTTAGSSETDAYSATLTGMVLIRK